MVPVIASSGASFRGAFDYYFHDKEARSTARVAWSRTLNMLTDCVEKAWKVMAYTAKNQDRLKKASGQKATGAKLKKPVFAYSLSWHPEQSPDQATMFSAAKESLEKLGLGEHQAMIAAHTDEPQPHVHIVVNAVHPVNGLVAKLRFTKRKLSDFAREYQQREGTNYCPKREENYQKRQKGEKTKYVDPVIHKAWENSTDGQSFVVSLKSEGYLLAQGRKRIVVVDRNGKTINPKRHLPGVSSKNFNDRMAGLSVDLLPSVHEAIQIVKEKQNLKDYGQNEDQKVQANATADKAQEKLRRYEERVADIIAAQQKRHAEELNQIHQDHSQAVRDVSKRFGTVKLENEINSLKDKLQSQGFWKKFLRLDRKIKKRLKTVETKLAQTQIRLNEKISYLNGAFESRLKTMDLRQEKERNDLIVRLGSRKPHFSQKFNARAVGKERNSECQRNSMESPDLGRS